MRIEVDFHKFDSTFEEIAMSRVKAAANMAADEIREAVPEGTVTRPIYRRGRYKGQIWTSREAGRLKKSVRVTRKRGKNGRLLARKQVRVYVGHYTAYYALIVEHSTPFFRRTFWGSVNDVRSILGVR